MRAVDPSTASATVNVIVKVTKVNEAPTFDEGAPTLLRVRENADPSTSTLEDGETPIPSPSPIKTAKSRAPTALTTPTTRTRCPVPIDSTGVLGFRTNREPDFEEKSSHLIIILARSGEGSRRLTARLGVAIEVVNTHDVGEVQLSQRQPQVGIETLATLCDPDGGVAFIGGEDRIWAAFEEASSGRRARHV